MSVTCVFRVTATLTVFHQLRDFLAIIFQPVDSMGIALDFTRKGVMEELLDKSHARSLGSVLNPGVRPATSTTVIYLISF
jgi:hypothetical protein